LIFYELFKIIVSVEGSDGSLPLDSVDESVFNHVGLILLVVNSEKISHFICYKVIVHCCAEISAKGILKRRLNNELAQSYTSLLLRHQVAHPSKK